MLHLIKDYAIKRADLLKMEVTEKSVTLIGALAFLVLTAFSALFFVILLLFGIGFLIGEYLDNYGYGILIVAAFYLLILLVLFWRRKSIKEQVANKILESLND
ncbi:MULTISPECIES: phage holin family protein [Chryseobacterium]|uniref:phage holin family protein n=1 Tax=Chryseobacterium sp. R2A-55 TaxID=2744445 RepID=UPI001F35826C|nr:phage holin family protein [Chryseobacterium sp. R2A-55]